VLARANVIEPLRSAIRAERQMGHFSRFSAARAEEVRNSVSESSAPSCRGSPFEMEMEIDCTRPVAAALLNEGAWLAWIFRRPK